MTDAPDRWAAGATYETFMGRWSRALAPGFLSWLEEPAGEHWLDVGCGTGAMVSAICEHAEPASALGCDPAEPFIRFARDDTVDERASYVVAGAGSLPAREGGFGSITSLLALNFFPDPGGAVREMRTLARGGATISACVWDYAGRMEFLRRFWDAASSLDPGAGRLDEGVRFPLCRPEALTALFEESGLDDVRASGLEVPTVFPSFKDYWSPFLGGTGPAPSYVASLDASQRDRLAGALERDLPRRPDGSIELVARAWAVRGRVG